MTRDEIKRGVADLRRMRERVAKGAPLAYAWCCLPTSSTTSHARRMLLRHVIAGEPPFYPNVPPYLSDADGLPTTHALAWIDTAIAYAEEHGR